MTCLENYCQKKIWNLLIALLQSFCCDNVAGWEQCEMMEEGLDKTSSKGDFMDPHAKQFCRHSLITLTENFVQVESDL